MYVPSWSARATSWPHRNANGNLEAILDKALDALLDKLEKERRPVRREIFARDGERCTFSDSEGRRCNSRVKLEIDHEVPRGRGGSDDASNLRVLCRAHNVLAAEQVYGREHIGQRIHLRQSRNDDALHVAHGALTRMGFRSRDVSRKLKELFPPETALPPLPELLRVALCSMVS